MPRRSTARCRSPCRGSTGRSCAFPAERPRPASRSRRAAAAPASRRASRASSRPTGCGSSTTPPVGVVHAHLRVLVGDVPVRSGPGRRPPMRRSARTSAGTGRPSTSRRLLEERPCRRAGTLGSSDGVAGHPTGETTSPGRRRARRAAPGRRSGTASTRPPSPPPSPPGGGVVSRATAGSPTRRRTGQHRRGVGLERRRVVVDRAVSCSSVRR